MESIKGVIMESIKGVIMESIKDVIMIYDELKGSLWIFVSIVKTYWML